MASGRVPNAIRIFLRGLFIFWAAHLFQEFNGTMLLTDIKSASKSLQGLSCIKSDVGAVRGKLFDIETDRICAQFRSISTDAYFQDQHLLRGKQGSRHRSRNCGIGHRAVVQSLIV